VRSPTRSVGIVGGLSAESTLWYFSRLIALSREHLAPDVTPRIVIANMNFAPLARWQHEGEWGRITAAVQREFDALEAAGCELLAIASNTKHKVLPSLVAHVPVVSIIDAVAAAGTGPLGLTGTRFTMTDGFYADALAAQGTGVVVPGPLECDAVHRIIYEELIRGAVEPASVRAFAGVCRGLLDRGAGAVLLGCTELAMLTRHPEWDTAVPTIDSAEVHARAIFEACCDPVAAG